MAILTQEFQIVMTGNPPPSDTPSSSATSYTPSSSATNVDCPVITVVHGSTYNTTVNLNTTQASGPIDPSSVVTCRGSVIWTATNTGSVTPHSGNWPGTHTPVPPPHASNGTIVQNPSVSSGAAAGLGVGLTILGILLGAAVAWCFFTRRHRKGQVSTTDETSVATSVLHSGPSDKATYPAVAGLGGSSDPPLDFYLLDGTGDSEIISELTALGHLIKDHAETNYHLRPIRHDAGAIRESLTGLGLDERTQGQIAALSLNSRTRHAVIRSLLAQVIFSALDTRTIGAFSLLPPSIVAFVQELPTASRSENPRSPAAKAFDTWRRLSVFLLHEKNQDRTPLLPPSSTSSQIKNLQNALGRFLGYFIHEDNCARTDQGRNLEGVIHECAAFGYTVFSHPCNWRYLLKVGPRKSSVEIVVMPGLERLSSRNGELYGTPQVVVRPTIVTI
ncbi:hypothetical protein QBC36DRAFT_339558 [Triangularia setosa]|uniref:Uncharacterized protein n=1 Tax=Triangularia setosa TaxID=2587417 RepID=A0AAN7A2H6_9PEZI|nr:hypothetical protein QBC36DRAFT_339558 [Podospora setosa]